MHRKITDECDVNSAYTQYSWQTRIMKITTQLNKWWTHTQLLSNIIIKIIIENTKTEQYTQTSIHTP